MGFFKFFSKDNVTIKEGKLQTRFVSNDDWRKCIDDFARQRADIEVITHEEEKVLDFANQFEAVELEDTEKEKQIAFIRLLDRLLLPPSINHSFPNETLQAYQVLVKKLLHEKQPNPLAWAAENDFSTVKEIMTERLSAQTDKPDQIAMVNNASLFYLNQLDQYFPESEANQTIRGHATALNQLRQALHQGALWTPMHTALETRASAMGYTLTRNTMAEGHEAFAKAHYYKLRFDASDPSKLQITETSRFQGYLNTREGDLVVAPKRDLQKAPVPLFQTSSTSRVTYTDDLSLSHDTVAARTVLLHDVHHQLMNIIACHTPTEMAQMLLEFLPEGEPAQQTLALAVEAFHAPPGQQQTRIEE